MYDFHCHTVYSDGVSRPEALVDAAIQAGVKAMAITDHDSTRSYEIAKRTAEASGSSIEIIPGIEINTVWNNHEVHVLGYFINPTDNNLQGIIQRHQQARVRQMKVIATNLTKIAKLRISYADICSCAHSEASLGRPHVAQAILKSGAAHSIGEAFQKYLLPKCETYHRRETVTPHEAVEAIYESGGVPVIAHPGDMPDVEILVTDLMNYGLRGLEAYHRSHSPAIIEFYCTMAEKYGLIVTGGTDYHGQAENYPQALNRLYMPGHLYSLLKQDVEKRQQMKIRAVS